MNLETFLAELPLSRKTPLSDNEKEIIGSAVALRAEPVESIEIIAGIYFLYDKGELVYIGQSNDIRQRVRQHTWETLKTFDSFAFIQIEDKTERLARETQLILTFAPKYNERYSVQGFASYDEHQKRLGLGWYQMQDLCEKYKVPCFRQRLVHVESLEKAFEAEGGKVTPFENQKFKHPTLFEKVND